MSRHYRADLQALAILVALSLTVHRGGLGFYSDDWPMLEAFSFSGNQTLAGLFRSANANPQIAMRPGQALYQAVLYWLFGAKPLPYHLVNAAVLVTVALIFYLVLRQLGFDRRISVAVPLVYSLLPHYSTARVWFAAFQAPLSMAFYFLSLYTALRSLEGSRRSSLALHASSTLALLASVLCYEAALPLFLLHPVLIGWAARRRNLSSPRMAQVRRRSVAVSATTLTALGAVVAYKLLTTIRLSPSLTSGALIRFMKQIAWINLWYYGLASPRILWRAFQEASAQALIVAVLLALLTGWYLHRISLQEEKGQVTGPEALRLVAWGGLVVVLGHAILVTAVDVSLSPTNRANRVSIAAAVGVALALVGGAAWITVHFQARYLPVLVAVMAAGSFLIDTYLISWWVTAYRVEREVLSAVRETFPTLPANTSLILDGACRQPGSGISFHSAYDLRGALALEYGDTTLRAGVVSPNLTVQGDGLHTRQYGEDIRYPYDKLNLFNFSRRTVDRLSDSAVARAYLNRYNPGGKDGPCPAHPVGSGRGGTSSN